MYPRISFLPSLSFCPACHTREHTRPARLHCQRRGRLRWPRWGCGQIPKLCEGRVRLEWSVPPSFGEMESNPIFVMGCDPIALPTHSLLQVHPHRSRGNRRRAKAEEKDGSDAAATAVTDGGGRRTRAGPDRARRWMRRASGIV